MRGLPRGWLFKGVWSGGGGSERDRESGFSGGSSGGGRGGQRAGGSEGRGGRGAARPGLGAPHAATAPGRPRRRPRRGAARSRGHELTQVVGPEPAGGRPGGGGAGRGRTLARGPGGRHGGQRPRWGRGVGGPCSRAGQWRPRAPSLFSKPSWGCRRGSGRRG